MRSASFATSASSRWSTNLLARETTRSTAASATTRHLPLAATNAPKSSSQVRDWWWPTTTIYSTPLLSHRFHLTLFVWLAFNFEQNKSIQMKFELFWDEKPRATKVAFLFLLSFTRIRAKIKPSWFLIEKLSCSQQREISLLFKSKDCFSFLWANFL